MLYDTVITIHSRLCFHVSDELCVTILKLTGSWYKKYTFKVNHALIPSWTHLIKFYQCRSACL